MLPTLKHIPSRSIVHIPGPPAIGSKHSTATLGIFYNSVGGGGNGGVPDGNLLSQYVLSTSTGTAPVWFAVSDGGAGYIPWGSWQVAVYLTGTPYPPTTNFAFRWTTAGIADTGAQIAVRIFNEFTALKNQAVSAGYGAAAKIGITDSYLGLGGPTPTGSVQFSAPYGVNLQVFWEGAPYLSLLEAPLPMVRAEAGYDNPLFMALWGPGNRAVLRATESGQPRRYPGYPYPYPPYYGPEPPPG